MHILSWFSTAGLFSILKGKSDGEAEQPEEPEEDDPNNKKQGKKLTKKTGGRKKKNDEKKVISGTAKPRDKWYEEFVDFQTKKQEIEEYLQDTSRRGSALPDEIKTDSIWISNTEKELADMVVGTLMQKMEKLEKVKKKWKKGASAASVNMRG